MPIDASHIMDKTVRVLFILFFPLFLFPVGIFAQPKAYFEHYGAEDGLPQHTITDILQDRKGFMWFSTWGGLCKFDGYTFTTFHLPYSHSVESKSSRIDKLHESSDGTIWTLSYDKQVHRFDPLMETFSGITSIEESDRRFSATQILPMKSGKVWLLSAEDGCICVLDSQTCEKKFHPKSNNLSGNRVYTVYEDKENNSWILTDKGITFLTSIDSLPFFYFHAGSEGADKPSRPFFSVMEFGGEIWFGANEGEIWRYDPEKGVFTPLHTGLHSNITSIREISSEKILIVSDRSGFAIYNTHDGSIGIYNRRTFPEMDFNEIFSDYIDHSKNIWLETDRLGVSQFNPYTGKYTRFTPYIESTESSVFPPNFFLFEDKEERLWIHPRGGGFSIYDKKENRLVPFYNEPFSPQWMFSNMMHSAYSDRQGNLWMCTRSHGLEKVIFYDDSQFKSIHLDNNANSTVSNDVRPIFQDSRGNTWAATKDGKIHLFNEAMQEIGILNEKGMVGTGKPLDGIAYCITEDSENTMWIGTKGEGVYKLSRRERENEFDLLHLKHDPADSNSLSDNNVYSIYEDKYKNIWIGTFGGGLNLIPHVSGGGNIINNRNGLSGYPNEQGNQVRVITGDRRGNVCVGTTLGFLMFEPGLEKPQEIECKVFVRSNDNSNSIGANDIIDICTTSSGETYIGTFGGGISKFGEIGADGFPVNFETYNSTLGLPSDIVLSIQEDNGGNLWIGSEGGLTKFNRKEQTFENFSEVKRLIKRYNFSESAKCRLRDGRMLFGYSHGMIIFNPAQVKNNTFTPYLALVQFKLFNRNVSLSPDGPLVENIDTSDQLVLKHKQNFIGIEYAALDYTHPKHILYAYKLDGFDKEWIYAGNQRIANYTNLSPGKYLFRVRSTNSDGVWAENERTLPIEVLSPFWATGWAYFVYVVLIALILFVVFRILHIFYTMRNKIVLEKQESEIKSRFFTNISHEIRTPLTMIVSPIEHLMQSKSTPDTVKEQLKPVSKNTNRLLNMVNQILDLQKMEQSPLTVCKIDIAPFVENIFNNYIQNAELNHIDYRFENKVGQQFLWIDPEAVEKIMVNLLTNAFKYTPCGQSISLAIFNKNGEVAIQIKDTGRGISKDKQGRLFKRFESFNEDKSKPSTGIGLSIVKEMADKHRATIVVDSEEDKGSVFTIMFKTGTLHFGPDTIINENSKTWSLVETPLQEDETDIQYAHAGEGRDERPCVLVVEDDHDLRQFIRSILEDEYEVHEALDGKEGFEKAVEIIPDFIVSDIMMPEVDGIELLEKIRGNIHTSHILFLLLTAKTTLESKLEGFEYGADEYITKPFSVSYFKARVKNLLQRRSELQKFYRDRSISNPQTQKKNEAVEDIMVNKQDIEFIRKINHFIEEHLGDHDFVIEDMAVETGMSRSVFFKKMKGLTGLAPIEYVRDILMQHAAELLEKGDYTVKEVSYRVGISDVKYFSRCFKKKYNIIPSEYKKRYSG